MDALKEQLLKRLSSIHQEQVLRYWDELSESEKEHLRGQIDRLNFEEPVLAMKCEKPAASVITPIETMNLQESEGMAEEFRPVGEKLLEEGKLAAVCLAGGMGTRLGFDGPKGALNVGVTKDLYIFEILLRNFERNLPEGRKLPFCIMTGDQNHEATVSFFEAHDYFGYPKDLVYFFRQDMAPALSFEGKILLSDRDSLALLPNGNGGWFSSLKSSGVLDKLTAQGVEWLNVFSVDNILQNIGDPEFLGACVKTGAGCGAKVICKASPEEKVGVICLRDGRTSVVEYSELTEEMRYQKNEQGTYTYNFGVTLNYLFELSELEKAAGMRLPIHRAVKKVSCLDEAGNLVVPTEPNAYKLEYFIFDILSGFDKVLPYECKRELEFAPIKNKEGNDSLETARKLYTEARGVTI